MYALQVIHIPDWYELKADTVQTKPSTTQSVIIASLELPVYGQRRVWMLRMR